MQEYSTVDPVFYTGLAFWILFTLAPIRALLGAVRRRRRPPATSGLSYHRLLGGRRLGVGEVYAPLVPKPCSRKFKEKVAATFAQLAPAAFDSIINGEEVAKILFGGGGNTDGGDAGGGFAAAVMAKEQQLQGGKLGDINARQKGVDEDEILAKNSLRASIAAGLHGTLSLIWRPRDIDHPEDEFLPRNNLRMSTVGPMGGALGTGIQTVKQQRPQDVQQKHSLSGSTSDSCDPESGQPTAPPPPHYRSRAGRESGANPERCSTNQEEPSSVYIRAIRPANPPSTNHAVVAAPRGGARTGEAAGTTRQALGRRRDSEPELDVFRPLGSGLSSYL